MQEERARGNQANIERLRRPVHSILIHSAFQRLSQAEAIDRQADRESE